jgi:predicted acyltransferase
MSVAAPPPPPDRLRSLDALRGFDMFWIIGGDALGQALDKWFFDTPDHWAFTATFKTWLRETWGKWFGGSPDNVLATQLEHVDWEGFRFYDLIFPLFLFMVGAVIPFSVASIRRRGASTAAVYFRIIRRVLLLFGLGLLSYGFLQLHWLVPTGDGQWAVNFHDHQRITGVLQRIAICYGISAMIALNTGWRAQLATVGVILLGYWAILGWVPNPETGLHGDYSMERNLGGWVDRHYLPGRLSPNYYGDRKKIAYGDNEGLLSTIPAVATTLLGVLAGQWLLSAAGPGRKTVGLFAAGVGCLALGHLWGLTFPVIKNLWTSSFVLIAGGWSFLLLALFYGIIDGLKWQWWAFPFVVIGVNAITIYVGHRFIGFDQMTHFFLGGAIHKVGDFGPVLEASGVLLFEWLFLYWLYRQRLFLRV